MKRGIRFTKKYLGIQPHENENMATTPVMLLTRWRLLALILRLVRVYLFLCVFWIGWHYALELLADVRFDLTLHMSQDLLYNSLMLFFLTGGMGVMLLVAVLAFVDAIRPLRKSASRQQIHNLEQLL